MELEYQLLTAPHIVLQRELPAQHAELHPAIAAVVRAQAADG